MATLSRKQHSRTLLDDAGADETYGQRANKLASQDFLEESARFISADEEILLDLPAYDDLRRIDLPTRRPEVSMRCQKPTPPMQNWHRRLQQSSIARAGGASPSQDTQRRINLQMGAWLGFHDGDTPLMARLAVYDLENDYYIFVNRKGVKMRQVSRLELLNLIDNGLVDILETNSNFRDEVTEVRKKLDQ